MSIDTIDKIIYIDPQTSNKIMNIAGSCEKYCVKSFTGETRYLKFSRSYDVFAEVLCSRILQDVGINSVKYDLVKETSEECRCGTISNDYSEGSKYRVSLNSIGEILSMIDRENMFSSIFCDVPKASEMIDKFCAMRPLLKYTKQDSENMKNLLYSQVIADYFICNGDHHTQNIECLVYEEANKERSITLGPDFDFGNCLRSPQSTPALTMCEEKAYDNNSQEVKFATSICNYFSDKYNNSEDLVRDNLFVQCCRLMNKNIFAEIYAMLTGYTGIYNYEKMRTTSDSYYDLFMGQIDTFNKTTGLNLTISDLDNMASAYKERVDTITDMFLSNELLGQAYIQYMKLDENYIKNEKINKKDMSMGDD